MRYVLPPGLTPEEERAVKAALDEYLSVGAKRPDPWTLAGRTEALGLGALQVRHQADVPWGGTRLNHYTRRGTEPRVGRGDSK
jgi:hypothetical protein